MRFVDELRRQRTKASEGIAQARRRGDEFLVEALAQRLADLERIASRNGVAL